MKFPGTFILLGVALGDDAVKTEDTKDAFNKASAGDEIVLSPGTLNVWDGAYHDSMLLLNGKPVSIACNADDRSCIWSASGLTRTVVRVQDTGGTTTFTKMTIRDGFASDSSSGTAGGILIYTDTVDLVLCTFTNNYAEQYGGGVFVAGPASTGKLTGCSFSDNRAAYGGDLYNYASASVEGCPDGYDEVKGEALSVAQNPVTGDLFSFECTPKTTIVAGLRGSIA